MTLPLALGSNDAEELDALRTVFFAADKLTDITLHLCSHRSQAAIKRCGCDDDRDCDYADQLAWQEISAQADVWKAVEKARPFVRPANNGVQPTRPAAPIEQ